MNSMDGDVELEFELEVTAVDDGSQEFLLRLSRLIPTLNVIELKRRVVVSGGRRLVPLGIRVSNVSSHQLIDQAKAENIVLELRRANEDHRQ